MNPAQGQYFGQPARPDDGAQPEQAAGDARGVLGTRVLIGITEIRLLFGVGRTSAYELTHRPGFPAPVRVSPRCYRWWLDEVTTFADELRSRAEERGRTRAVPRASGTSPHGPTESLRISGRIRPARRRQEAR